MSASNLLRTIDKMDYRQVERTVQRSIEDRGYVVHDANIVFGINCPNIDLIVYNTKRAVYVQVKGSMSSASRDHVVVNGSPWTEGQLWRGEPVFNRVPGFVASVIAILHRTRSGQGHIYLASPETLEQKLVPRAQEWARTPKRNGSVRSLGFRKELPEAMLVEHLEAWGLLGEPIPKI